MDHAPGDQTVTALLASTVARDADARLFAIPDSFGGWFDITAQEFLGRVRGLAKGFLAADLRVGDALGILCSTRFEATLVDFAAAQIGVAIVPLRPSAGQSELLAVLDDASVQAVVVETPRDFARFDEIHGDLPQVSDVWQIGLGDLDKLADLGRTVSDEILDDRAAAVTETTPAVVFYAAAAAAGATEAPAATTLDHGTLHARVRELSEVFADETGADASTLQILPATDVHARLSTLVAVATGTRLGHLRDPGALLATMASFRPTLLVAYPETFVGIDEAALVRAELSGRATALRQGLEVAVDHSVALSAGTVPRGLKTRFALAEALVYRGLRKAVGGRLRLAVSIATESSLTPRLRHIMRSLDVHAVEGYGTVETTGLVVVERLDDAFERPIGSIGTPLHGVEIAIADDGAVALRGQGVQAAGSGDGWLHTALFGALDDGRLVLADRDLPPTAVVPDETLTEAERPGSSAAAEL